MSFLEKLANQSSSASYTVWNIPSRCMWHHYLLILIYSTDKQILLACFTAANFSSKVKAFVLSYQPFQQNKLIICFIKPWVIPALVCMHVNFISKMQKLLEVKQTNTHLRAFSTHNFSYAVTMVSVRHMCLLSYQVLTTPTISQLYLITSIGVNTGLLQQHCYYFSVSPRSTGMQRSVAILL